ncbi:ABC transporter substrate-binding protein [Amphibacillus sediminis]|uniref:ABC transporter substrate-binding protein n=1 Tax=Amphibacillus sediminis TaxID=360185 RepID=UPI00082CD39C|nr:ABC transporter substrate-binding protein [Amphibacillus sediminis]
MLIDRYYTLCLTYSFSYHQPISITIADLAKLFYCSERNVKIIIKKMQERAWIDWQAGKGRGHHSRIILRLPIEDVILQYARELVDQHSIDEAIEFIQSYQLAQGTLQAFLVEHVFNNSYRQSSLEQEEQVRFPSYRPLAILDPASVNRRTENHIMRHLYASLLTFNQNEPYFLPGLAHAWETNADQSKWLFYLRKDLYFHNGKKLIAEDVKHSLLRHKNKDSPYRWFMNHIDKIEVVTTLIIRISCKQSMPYLLDLFATLAGAVLLKSDGQIVGAGPFKVVENTKDRLNIAVHQSYYGTRPLIDRVTLYFFPKLYNNTKQKIDSSLFPINFYPYPYQRDTKSFKQYTAIDKGSKMLTLNGKTGLLSRDHELRQAICQALQSQRLIKDLAGSRSVPATRMRRELEQVSSRNQTIEQAESSLNLSSYQGKTLRLASYHGAGNEQDGNWIQDRLKEVGLIVELAFFDYQDFFQQDLTAFDLLLSEQLADENPLITYFNTFLGDHSVLSSHLPNKTKADIETLFVSSDWDRFETLAILDQIEGQLVTNHYCHYLYRLKQYAIYPSYFRGVTINALGWIDFTKLWFASDI